MYFCPKYSITMKRIYLMLTIVFASISVAGQSSSSATIKTTKSDLLIDNTPTLLYQYYFGELDSLGYDAFAIRHINTNPYYYRLFTPLAFYYAPVRQINELTWVFQPLDTLPDQRLELLPFEESKFVSIKRINRQVNSMLLDTYMERPDLVVTTESRIRSRQTFREDKGVDKHTKTSVLSLFKPEDMIDESIGEAGVVIHKPNFWVTGGSGSLQFTQNYISGNWYKGGDSNQSMLGYLQLFANYNDKEKVQFENLIEAKVGFMTNKADTMHSYKMNYDVFRLYSKLGIQAAKNWYYTVSGEFNSQFFRNYKTNTNTVQSAFLSPANLILSIGMDYKKKTKTANLSVFISPLAYNFRYVGSSAVNETKFGLKEGKSTMHDFGSKLQTTLSWKVTSAVIYDTRLYYFTNYQKVEAEWENTINFVLNRYLSTKLFMHARFDDGAKRVGDKSYFQLQELLSFGINYKW